MWMNLNTAGYKTFELSTNEQWRWSLFHESEKNKLKKRAREFCLQWRLTATTARKDAYYTLQFGLQRHLQIII